MPTTSAYEQIANELKVIIDTCYAAEGFVAEHDELHESLGFEGTRIGIAQDERGEEAWDSNNLAQEIWVVVRFQGAYNLQVDPRQKVDPRIVANYAERFRRAVQDANIPYSASTPRVWFYDIRGIRYPRDPTGNKTRFFATIHAYGNNSGLVETIG